MDERDERIQRIKRIRRKRVITVLVLCGVLVALVGGYKSLIRHNEERAAKEAAEDQERIDSVTEKVQITDFLLRDVSEFAFTNADASYHFVWKQEGNYGNWVRQGQENFPTNAEKVQTIAGYFCNMTGTRKISGEGVVLETYGLDDTRFTATLTLNDGMVEKFRIGDAAPYSAGRYMLKESTGEVFIVSDLIYKQLSTEEKKLVQGETFPSAMPEKISQVRIEIEGRETATYVPTTKEDGTKDIPTIFYDCISFVASTIQEYNCTDYAKYGLDDPYARVTVDYTGYVMDETGNIIQEETSMVLEIGDKTVSDNYFVRVNGTDFVYIMVKAQAEKYLQ